MAVVCLSICLSVSPVSDHKSWMEGRSKQKIGKKDHGWPNIFSQLVHWSRPYYEHIAIRIIIIELSFAFYANKQQLCVRKSSALQAGLSQPQNKDCITSEGILLQFNIRKAFNFIITLSNHTTILLMKYFKNWSQLYRLRRQLHDPTDETWRKVISVEDMWLGLWVRKFPEISGGIFPEISGKITVLFRNNSVEKTTCQTPSFFRTMSTFWNVF